MLNEKVSFEEAHAFSSIFLEYIRQENALRPFYNRFPDPTEFAGQISEKSSFPTASRQLLVDTLLRQYKELEHPEVVHQNIQSLAQENTFTITTGHQLNIFTGPLYFIYKIVTVINTCRQLRQRYPDTRFVPVYWMASEDHDFEEISYFRLYGKKYTWQTDQQGGVGRFSTNGLLAQMKEVPGDLSPFTEAYAKHKNLADAARHYVNALFGSEGLVVVDADDRGLKGSLREVIRKDLFQQETRKRVGETDTALQAAGYKPAVHARDINFFYLDAGIRGRLERNGDLFTVVDTPLSFTTAQIEKMIADEPEKFSPNVILRPLYQEMILPNLAYIGGPAEVVYWLQLKNVFGSNQVPFPILMPRNFAMVMDAPARRKFVKTGLELKDVFEEKNYLFNHWVIRNTHHNITLSDAISNMEKIMAGVHDRATTIDQTLGPLISAETKRALSRLERIEMKLLKAERRLHGDKLRQIETLKDALFPGGSLQERTDNFLGFFQQDTSFLRKLITHFDPFDFRFNILSYDDEG